MIFSPSIECADREEIQRIQLQGLISTVKRVYEKVPYYKEKLDAAGVKPEDIKSLSDITRLPFTTKADMRANFPYRLFAVPMRDIVRIHASSGTTGTATVVGYTLSLIHI